MKGSKAVSGFMLGMFLLAGLAQGQTLRRVDAGGGYVSPPVAHGNYLYAGTGATLSTWDMSDPAHPVYAGRSNGAPERGPIGGVAVVGGYLYVSWYTTYDEGGITVFSLADPAHPQAVAELDDYIVSDYKRPQALVASGNHVYVGDADNGLVVLDTTDPLHPLALAQNSEVTAFDTMAVFGNKLLSSGRGFIGGVVSVIDISNPAAPVVAGAAVRRATAQRPCGVSTDAVSSVPFGSGTNRRTIVDWLAVASNVPSSAHSSTVPVPNPSATASMVR